MSAEKFANGGLLIASAAAVALLASSALQHESVDYAATGINEARVTAAPSTNVATPVPAPSTAPVPSLSAEMRQVRDYLARRYRVSAVALEPVLKAAELNARKVGLDPLLVVAVIAVESSFNPFAESQMGAQGLMQVIPRFHMDKIGANTDEDALFDPVLNVRVGTLVLDEGMRRFGSLEGALQYYGGALNDPEAGYSRKVLAVKERLSVIAGRRQVVAQADA